MIKKTFVFTDFLLLNTNKYKSPWRFIFSSKLELVLSDRWFLGLTGQWNHETSYYMIVSSYFIHTAINNSAKIHCFNKQAIFDNNFPFTIDCISHFLLAISYMFCKELFLCIWGLQIPSLNGFIWNFWWGSFSREKIYF